MAIRTSAGTKLFISASLPTTYNLSSFTALGSNFKEVGEITDLGSFGKKYNKVTHNPLGDRATVKRKGSYDPGTLSLKMAASVGDVGQDVIQAAADSDDSYAFKVVTQSGSIFYFTGQVMGWTMEIGSVDQVMAASADVEIDAAIIKGVQNA